ncbi:MAG: general secretion pathway protein G [Hyphomicrobiaceae bacterium]|jgi:general secretion pathway protein G
MNAKNQSSLHSAPACATQRGFTLVEIMVVIVILGLLATLVVPNIMGASDEAKETKARTDCKLISGAVRMYYTRNSRLPETLEELATKDDRGRSELEEMPMDPWNTPYELVSGDTPREFEVVCCGPDTQLGTEDDISSKLKDRE